MVILAIASASFGSEEFVVLMLALVALLRPGLVVKLMRHIGVFRATPTSVEFSSRSATGRDEQGSRGPDTTKTTR